MLRTFMFLLMVLPAGSAAAAVTLADLAGAVVEADAAIAQELLASGLIDGDPALRATAARVAAVRGEEGMLPRLTEALGTEADPSAARELLRAVALIGGAESFDTLLEAARRHAPLLNPALADAVARVGGGPALSFYFDHLIDLPRVPRVDFFYQALWGRSALATVAGAKLIHSGDAAGWSALLSALAEAEILLDPGMASVGLAHELDEFRAATAWYLIQMQPKNEGALDDRISMVVMDQEPPPDGSSCSRFGREILRRMAGATYKESVEWNSWIDSEQGEMYLRNAGEVVGEWLTPEETARMKEKPETAQRASAKPLVESQEVYQHPWTAPVDLPRGVAAAVLEATRCSGHWIGVAGAVTDLKGRVQDVDLEQVYTEKDCRKALEILMKLSLVSNRSINSPIATNQLLLVKDRRGSLCFDEPSPADGPVRARAEFGSARCNTAGDANITPPKTIRRVQPDFPADARKELKRLSGGPPGVNLGGVGSVVTIEATITKEGCVRDLRLVQQSPVGQINSAALLALSQWRFEPGRLNGEPVDVIFNLTVSFSVK